MPKDSSAATALPWSDTTTPDRVAPRECIGNARNALDRAYGIRERAAVPLLIEALDWLRRGLEQMAPDEHPVRQPDSYDRIDGLRPKG